MYSDQFLYSEIVARERSASDLNPRVEFLINEIINVTPTTRSEFYPANWRATVRLRDLRAELIAHIISLQVAAAQK